MDQAPGQGHTFRIYGKNILELMDWGLKGIKLGVDREGSRILEEFGGRREYD